MWPFSTKAIPGGPPAYEHYLQLTDKEIMEMGTDPVSTVTRVDSIDEKLLRDRVQQMLSKNPWLAGRFVKHSYDDDPELGRYGHEGGASYSKLMQMAENHLLKAGQNLKQQQLWKLTIVKPSVLIVSMTHSLGDSATLFQMLLSGKIEAVPIERVFGFIEKKEKIIQDLKANASTDETVRYIPTNDIITSWFFKTANLGHPFMAINLRGRMDELKDQNMVGNYEDLFLCRALDVETPELIRKSPLRMKRAVTGEPPIQARRLAFSTMSIISNCWSTFSNLGDAVGFKVVGHTPVSEIEKSVPFTIAICIVFEARPGQLGVMVLEHRQN